MSEANSLLIEIGTEELPPKALKKLRDAFGRELQASLKDAELGYEKLTTYASPRRLAIIVDKLIAAQPDSEELRRGPAVKAAFDAEGNPTKAASGFAASCGVSVDQLEKLETEKGSWLAFQLKKKGESVSALLPAMVEQALNKLPIPKRMRWGQSEVSFVRPIHWVVLMYGDAVIDSKILDIEIGTMSRGHRFHHPDDVNLTGAEKYLAQLRDAYVMVDFAERRGLIEQQINDTAKSLGGSAVIDPGLLDEVTALVEWPVPIAGQFEDRFLELPKEVLISTMKGHQKYFHVVDDKGDLLPYFITLSNIESSNPETIKAGNERVIRPRLSDSAYFWKTDLEAGFSAWVSALEKVVFQAKLGSIADKTQRISTLAARIAETLGEDVDLARRAGELSKCDLMSDMVGEFPDLQGIMGRYYAEKHGEDAAVAIALDEQYMPRFAGDQLPQGAAGQAVSIADKIDTLVGIFGIGQPPTGVKDPFALRRAALGVLRIMIEQKRDLDLHTLLTDSAELYGDKLSEDNVVESVLDYMLERLRSYYADQSIPPTVFDAVAARRPTRPVDFDQRIQAVMQFRELAEAESLAAANKRISNILKKQDVAPPEQVDEAVLQETAEKDLLAALNQVKVAIKPDLEQHRYAPALAGMASLRDPIDAFFDQVMVMCDDEALRLNRLALLDGLQALFLQVADISRLQK